MKKINFLFIALYFVLSNSFAQNIIVDDYYMGSVRSTAPIMGGYAVEAYLSNLIYNRSKREINKSFYYDENFDGTYKTVTLRKYENNSSAGFTAGIFETNDGKMVIAFGGTTAREKGGVSPAWVEIIVDILADAMLLNYNEMPSQIWHTIDFMRMAKQYANDHNINWEEDVVITGHSLGGGLAQYATLMTGVPAVTFNTAPAPITPKTLYAMKSYTSAIDPTPYCATCNLAVDFIHENKILNIFANDDPLTSILEGIEVLEYNSFHPQDEHLISERFNHLTSEVDGVKLKINNSKLWQAIKVGSTFISLDEAANLLFKGVTKLFTHVAVINEDEFINSLIAFKEGNYPQFVSNIKAAYGVPEELKLTKLIYGNRQNLPAINSFHSMYDLITQAYQNLDTLNLVRIKINNPDFYTYIDGSFINNGITLPQQSNISKNLSSRISYYYYTQIFEGELDSKIDLFYDSFTHKIIEHEKIKAFADHYLKIAGLATEISIYATDALTNIDDKQLNKDSKRKIVSAVLSSGKSAAQEFLPPEYAESLDAIESCMSLNVPWFPDLAGTALVTAVGKEVLTKVTQVIDCAISQPVKFTSRSYSFISGTSQIHKWQHHGVAKIYLDTLFSCGYDNYSCVAEKFNGKTKLDEQLQVIIDNSPVYNQGLDWFIRSGAKKIIQEYQETISSLTNNIIDILPNKNSVSFQMANRHTTSLDLTVIAKSLLDKPVDELILNFKIENTTASLINISNVDIMVITEKDGAMSLPLSVNDKINLLKNYPPNVYSIPIEFPILLEGVDLFNPDNTNARIIVSIEYSYLSGYDNSLIKNTVQRVLDVDVNTLASNSISNIEPTYTDTGTLTETYLEITLPEGTDRSLITGKYAFNAMSGDEVKIRKLTGATAETAIAQCWDEPAETVAHGDYNFQTLRVYLRNGNTGENVKVNATRSDDCYSISFIVPLEGAWYLLPRKYSKIYVNDSGDEYVDSIIFGDINEVIAGEINTIAVDDTEANINLSNGLVAHYEFEGNANDSSGNGNNGIINGNPGNVVGKFDNALEFNSSNNSSITIEHDASINPTKQLTISFWVNPTKFSNAYNSVIYKSGELNRTSNWSDRIYSIFITNNGAIHFSSTPENGNGQVVCDSGDSLIPIGSFSHITGKVDAINGEMEIYVNGVIVKSCSYPVGNIKYGEFPLYISSLTDGNYSDTTEFDGIVDDFRIYNRAINPDEIKALYDLKDKVSTPIINGLSYEESNTSPQFVKSGHIVNNGTHYAVWSNGTYTSNDLFSNYDKNIRLSTSNDGDNWSTENILNSTYGSTNHIISIDNNGKIHVAYNEGITTGTYGISDWKLIYATNKSGNWVKTVIKTTSGYRSFTPTKLISLNDGSVRLFYNKTGWWKYNSPLYEVALVNGNFSAEKLVSNMSFGHGDPDDSENILVNYEVVNNKLTLYISSGYSHLSYHGDYKYSGYLYKLQESDNGWISTRIKEEAPVIDIDNGKIANVSTDWKSVYFDNKLVDTLENVTSQRSTVSYDDNSGIIVFTVFPVDNTEYQSHIYQYNPILGVTNKINQLTGRYIVSNGLLFGIKAYQNPKQFVAFPINNLVNENADAQVIFKTENLPDYTLQLGATTKTWTFTNGSSAITDAKAVIVTKDDNLGINQSEITLGDIAANATFNIELPINPSHTGLAIKTAVLKLVDDIGTEIPISNSGSNTFWLKLRTNHPPLFDPNMQTNLIGATGSTLSLTLKATDKEGDNLSYSLDSGAGASVSGNILTFTSPDNALSHNIVVAVSDGKETIKKTLTAFNFSPTNVLDIYSDVTSGDAHADSIAWATLKGLVNGSVNSNGIREFKPNSQPTWSELLAMIVNGAVARGTVTIPTDVIYKAPGLVPSWVDKYYTTAITNNVINSTQDLSKAPTNEDVAHLVLKLLKLDSAIQGLDLSHLLSTFTAPICTSSPQEHCFSSASSRYEAQLLHHYGLFMTDLAINPKGLVTRGQVADVMARMMQMPSATLVLNNTPLEQGSEISITVADDATLKAPLVKQDGNYFLSDSDQPNAKAHTSIRQLYLDGVAQWTQAQSLNVIPVIAFNTALLSPNLHHFTVELENTAAGIRAFQSIAFEVLFTDSDYDGVQDSADVWVNDSRYHADVNGNDIPDILDSIFALSSKTLSDTVSLGQYEVTVQELINQGGFVCPQTDYTAIDPDTGELKQFSSPCDVPTDWQFNEANLDLVSKVFKQQGQGSTISHYGQTELNNSNRYGISKDEIKLHADGSIPIAMVQWQTDINSCSKLKLSMADSRLANVQITYGAWDNRQDDVIFTDVNLPFVIGAENTQDGNFADGSWRVLSVGFDQALNSEATLKVECSLDPVTNATAVQTTELIALENNQQWQGTGSIISGAYSSIGTENPYGILRDEVVLKPVEAGKVNGNPSVFFQWQGSEYCRAIELNTTVDGLLQSSIAVLGLKDWNAMMYQTEQITLPYRLEQPMTDDGGLQDWSLLQLDFQAVEQDTKVTAHCLQNSSHYTWSGNGSVVSHTGVTYLGNAVDQYGITKDSVSIHANTNYPPVGFFQWQIDTNQCSSLTFDVDDESVRNNATVNITYGAWSQREDDKVFKQVRLPFTVNSSNMGETHTDGTWRVLAVAFNEIQSVSTNLNARCSNNVSSSASPVVGEAIVLENGSIWSGTGSIIRSEFSNSIGNATPYGVTRDVSKIHAGKNNSVLLQWQPSDECMQLHITGDNSSTKQDFEVNWGMKSWNAEEYEMISSQLPLTIDRTDSTWSLIRLDFSNDVTETTQIKADCL